ncbi:hypothetical protein [Melissococcus plutonius]|uniref:hypothetical protein n=1 Tax=Melissococcus plutonius TaxID=33970 RepID=UPI001E28ACBB|nr:hypothetical protein [Melissococcus plutonius]
MGSRNFKSNLCCWCNHLSNYPSKKNREKAIQKIIRIEWRLASYIVKEQHEHPEIDIKELYSYQEFMKNYSRTMLIGEDDQLLDLTRKLKELLVKLADKNCSSTSYYL